MSLILNFAGAPAFGEEAKAAEAGSGAAASNATMPQGRTITEEQMKSIRG